MLKSAVYIGFILGRTKETIYLNKQCNNVHCIKEFLYNIKLILVNLDIQMLDRYFILITIVFLDTQFQCQPNEFQCENKKCVLKVWRCDGDNDCGDNTDEKSCSKYLFLFIHYVYCNKEKNLFSFYKCKQI